METPKLSCITNSEMLRIHSLMQAVINLSSLLHTSHLMFHERHREVTNTAHHSSQIHCPGNACRLQPKGRCQEQVPNRDLPVRWIKGCRELKETVADAKTQTGGKKDKDISM